jgi:MoCo/4Fe-4S cofactor protein with predicted Tat translocation signal
MATDSVNNLVQIKPAAAAPSSEVPRLQLEAVRERLADARGPQYWRTLEELSDEPGFQEMLEREFPRQAGEWTDPVSRRGFLKLMSASLALAGLSACTRQPEEAIVPYVQQPEDLVPGKPLFYATARPTPFGAYPLLVESHMFRPVKVEGNPDHHISKGATDAQSQASILDLYDPDRTQAVMYNGGLPSRRGQNPGERTWGDFLNDLRPLLALEKSRGGAGLRILTETIISPTLGNQIRGILQAYPQAKWYQYEPINRDAARAGSRMAFGQYVEPQYNLAAADVIVSLDADFLSGSHFPNFLKLARDYVSRRKLDGPQNANLSRMYVVESQTTTTGGKADHRLAMRASDIEQFASALAGALGAGGGGNVPQNARKLFDALVKDLQAAGGRSVIIPGEQQPASVHVLAAAINGALGNVGKTVAYTDPVEMVPTEHVAGIRELTADMNAGRVNMLLMIGVNPVFNAPIDLNFEVALNKVGFRAALSTHRDETTQLCHWHIPMAHYLESWSDARAFDGTVSIIQPLIAPLYGGKTAHEMIAALSDSPGKTPYELVREYWQAQAKPADLNSWWRQVVHDGYIPNSAFAPKTVSAKGGGATPSKPAGDLEVVFRPDPSIHDGRFINNGWLQELPKLITKLTWDNAALMSLATYQQFFGDEKWRPGRSQVVELTVGGRKVNAPVMVVPGHPDKSITVHLGYGRAVTGRVGSGTGFNAYTLRTSEHPALNTVAIAKTGDTYPLGTTQHHHLIDANGSGTDKGPQGSSETGNAAIERKVVRAATIEEFKADPHRFKDHYFYARKGMSEEQARKAEEDLTLFGENGYAHWTEDPAKTPLKDFNHQWGMAIDMNSCIGCNACIAACNAENNIPVVGKEQVLVGREMIWLRIDTYFESAAGDVANPRAYFQPVPCMQCENAPCEPVCPVAATVHSPEGLNNMVYNRCVGTRYCSNNCPYKVRRFNFLLYSDWETESLHSMRNPDVSVRSRGVMEKCTYCVQRINEGRIQAEKQNRKVRDGEVLTACQQTCPTDAIIFGDINDPNSAVSKLKKQERNYAMLAEINTRPRTTYLASVRNPNLALEPTKHGESEGHAG